MFSYYSNLSSEVYDLDKPIGHSFGDIEFYLERLATSTGKILEPAVGTGRMLIPLLENGLNVEGFDVSSEMLTICRDHCGKRGLNPKLFTASMQDFQVDQKYEAIILASGTFLLLHEREDSLKALTNFYHHLADGGRLIFDIFLQTDIELGKSHTKTWECENGDVITLETKITQVDYIHQYTVSHNRYEKWRNGVLQQTELERFPLRWYGVEEIKLILQTIGFNDITISTNYKYGKYPTQADQSITFEAVAKK